MTFALAPNQVSRIRFTPASIISRRYFSIHRNSIAYDRRADEDSVTAGSQRHVPDTKYPCTHF
jgi:hypothetical protein